MQVKEVALLHSEGILAGEMKHGPLALVDDTLPIIVIATKDPMHGKMHSVIQQLLARKANLIVFVSEVWHSAGLTARPFRHCLLYSTWGFV